MGNTQGMQGFTFVYQQYIVIFCFHLIDDDGSAPSFHWLSYSERIWDIVYSINFIQAAPHLASQQ